MKNYWEKKPLPESLKAKVTGEMPTAFKLALEKHQKAKKKVEMGMKNHPGMQPGFVWPRSFRFTAQPKSCPDIMAFFKSLDINMAWQSLEIKLYDTVDGSVHNWISSLLEGRGKDESLTINFYDGCGEELFSIVVSDLVIVAHSMPLDYSSSDVLTHELILEYSHFERIATNKTR